MQTSMKLANKIIFSYCVTELGKPISDLSNSLFWRPLLRQQLLSCGEISHVSSVKVTINASNVERVYWAILHSFRKYSSKTTLVLEGSLPMFHLCAKLVNFYLTYFMHMSNDSNWKVDNETPTIVLFALSCNGRCDGMLSKCLGVLRLFIQFFVW